MFLWEPASVYESCDMQHVAVNCWKPGLTQQRDGELEYFILYQPSTKYLHRAFTWNTVWLKLGILTVAVLHGFHSSNLDESQQINVLFFFPPWYLFLVLDKYKFWPWRLENWPIMRKDKPSAQHRENNNVANILHLEHRSAVLRVHPFYCLFWKAGLRIPPKSCPVWRLFQIDNKGNHLLVSEEASINVPAIAAAHVTKRYTAQATDELTFEVRPPPHWIWSPDDSECVWLYSDRLSLCGAGGRHRVRHRHASERGHGLVEREARLPGESLLYFV